MEQGNVIFSYNMAEQTHARDGSHAHLDDLDRTVVWLSKWALLGVFVVLASQQLLNALL